jgi:hypothetical protein
MVASANVAVSRTLHSNSVLSLRVSETARL